MQGVVLSIADVQLAQLTRQLELPFDVLAGMQGLSKLDKNLLTCVTVSVQY